jgi:hypothetical protein
VPEALQRDRGDTRDEALDHPEEEIMTTSTTAENDNHAGAATVASTAVESADRERSASRREAVLATALVALVAAVALFGLAFPQLLAPAVAIAVLAAIVALDWLLPSGELRQVSARFWKR